jgi:hypothetical protein
MVVRHVLQHEIVNRHSLLLVLSATQTESLQLTSCDFGLGEALVVFVGVQQEHGADQVLLQNVGLLHKILLITQAKIGREQKVLWLLECL